MAIELNKIIHGDNVETLRGFPDESIDMVLTSPPYDNLRTYGGDQWDFEGLALQLLRTIKVGGVIVWNVSDATVNGSESGTSFRQALHFKDIGLNLHDTMIFRKNNPMPLTHNRYEQEFEFIFVLSKGRPKAWNPIMKRNVSAGSTRNYSCKSAEIKSSRRSRDEVTTIKEESQRGNVFDYTVAVDSAGGHPAPFPVEFARDMIRTWTNPKDVVLDPFMGSGTTALACKKDSRHFVGVEINAEYIEKANKRIQQNYFNF